MSDQCPNCGEVKPVGVQIRGLYDGVLLWECSACQYQWPRFPSGRLRRVALEVIADRA